MAIRPFRAAGATGPADWSAARDLLVAAADAAGRLVLPFFRHGAETTASIGWKGGQSPVTEADHAADAFLRERLTGEFPGAAWLSEETADDRVRLDAARLLIVDPIDGTRAFMTGDPRWAVCAALVVAGRPVAGVVHLPALGETYAAAAGAGARLNGAPIAASRRTEL
ncbi:MAG: 3'(2'),5'-bisphosphate nucleotidase CysQ, partial [Methylobacteriaceae bacterium]|nr:3'(2'),5'-bisphosphate nucleotidase CysQ [Methylobacteriaceae bacterium]